MQSRTLKGIECPEEQHRDRERSLMSSGSLQGGSRRRPGHWVGEGLGWEEGQKDGADRSSLGRVVSGEVGMVDGGQVAWKPR